MTAVQSNRLSGRMIDAAGIGAILAISFAGYWVGVRPAMKRTEEIKSAFNSLASREREAREAEAARLDVERELAAATASLASAVRLVPVSKMNERLAALADAAKRNDIAVSQLTPGAPVIGPKYVSVPVKLSGSCSYLGLTDLLRQIRRDMPDTAVSTIAIAVDPSGKEATSAYSIDLVWFAAPAGLAGAPVEP